MTFFNSSSAHMTQLHDCRLSLVTSCKVEPETISQRIDVSRRYGLGELIFPIFLALCFPTSNVTAANQNFTQ